jgi:predicted DNA-binding transcriptional regulator AlpA
MQPANDNNRTPHWPRGLSRLRAAAYIGVTPQAFDRMVAEEQMPPRTKIGGVWRWDKLAVDRNFDALFNTQTDLAGEEVIEFAA